jgi:hypothetical protein
MERNRIRIRIKVKSWIRISIKTKSWIRIWICIRVMRIRNPRKGQYRKLFATKECEDEKGTKKARKKVKASHVVRKRACTKCERLIFHPKHFNQDGMTSQGRQQSGNTI